MATNIFLYEEHEKTFPLINLMHIKNFSIKGWDKHININLKAPAILIKQFAKIVSKNIKANIINI